MAAIVVVIRVMAVAVSVMVAAPAEAERLVVALSTQEVRIASNFSGATVSLFGVIERDSQAVSRTGPYEVVVIAKGPPQDVLVQRRKRVFGIWMNDAGERFRSIPSYWGLFTTPGGQDLVQREEGPEVDPSLRWLGPQGHRTALRHAIAERRRGSGLYVENFEGVDRLTDTFFTTEIPLPGIVNDGRYSIDVVLYNDGLPLDVEKTHVNIAKVGFEQRLFDLAQAAPLLYGLAAVALALVTGYVGGVVFRRG